MNQSQKLFNYLEKARALLAKAESTEFPEEAAALRAKAEHIMREYRIDEEQLIAAAVGTVPEPILLKTRLCDNGSAFLIWYCHLADLVAEHVGARVACFQYDPETKQPTAHFVGYEGDVRVAVELLTAAQLVFAEKLEPKVDASKTDRENIYRLRSSGITRWDVAIMLWGQEEGAKASAHAKVGRIYKEECAARGETVALDGKGINLEVFRKSYCREFYWTLDQRLDDARSAVDAEGGVLVLRGRKERVDEAFYTHFPNRRPKPMTQVAKQTTTTPARARRATKAEQDRLRREYHSPAARAGGVAGSAAGREVQISRITPRTKRVEEGSGVPRNAIEG